MNDAFFQALSNPCRREIIRLLRWRNLSAGEIVAHFSIAQPSVSRHLEVLRRAELVTAERRGNQIIYSLNLTAAQDMLVSVAELFDLREQKEVTEHGAEKKAGMDQRTVDPGGDPVPDRS